MLLNVSHFVFEKKGLIKIQFNISHITFEILS